MPRKPWEIPIEYTDTRWGDPSQRGPSDADEAGDEEQPLQPIDAGPKRGSRLPEDETTLDYSRGPHAEELDLGDDDEGFEPADDDDSEFDERA